LAGVSYAVSVQPIAQYLVGPTFAVTSAFKLGIPTNVSGVSASAVPPTGTLRISWLTADTYDSTGPITGYRISRAGGPSVTVAALATSADISGLSTVSQTTLSIVALNTYGESATPTAVSGTAQQYSSPPNPSPDSYAVFQLDSTFAFKISVVTSTILQPVEGYRIYSDDTLIGTVAQAATGKTTIYAQVRAASAAAAPKTAEYLTTYGGTAANVREDQEVIYDGLVLGTSYIFRIAPYNFVGEATGVTLGAKTCITTPARVVSDLAIYSSPTTGYYKLKWTPGGTVNAGKPVDEYRLYVGGSFSGKTTAALQSIWTGLDFTVGAAVYIVAKNIIGEGTPSTTLTVPTWSAETAVTGLAGTVKYGGLDVSWNEKGATWGLPTVDYVVTCTGAADKTVAAGTTATSFSVTNGSTVTTTIKAKNALAEETPVASAGPYVLESVGPTVGVITESSHAITVTWSPLANVWGAATTGYKIYTLIGGVTTLAAQPAAGDISATITGLPNLITVGVSIVGVNAAGQVTSESTWPEVSLEATIPQISGLTAVGGLAAGMLRLTQPSEVGGTNPDLLVATNVYDLTVLPSVTNAPPQITFTGATYDLTASFVAGTAYTIGLKRIYNDRAPWQADTYKTAELTATARVQAPLTYTLAAETIAGQPLTAKFTWTATSTWSGISTYYRIIRVIGPTGTVTYVTLSTAATASGNYTVSSLAAGTNTFSIAITTAGLAAEDIPQAVWDAAGLASVTVLDGPAAPTLTNALVFDAAGNATDTFTVAAVPTAEKPITSISVYDASGSTLIGTVSGASGTVPYTYALSVLGTTKNFYAVATNTMGTSAQTPLAVSVVGSLPYAAREATGVSVTASTINASSATVTLGWTKFEPNSVYFPVTGFRVDVSRAGTWVQLGVFSAAATSSGALNVTTDVVTGTTITLRVVQLGDGASNNSVGVQVQRTYTLPAVGTAALGTLSSAEKVITVPWTYTGTVANIQGLTLDISGLGVQQPAVTIAAAASGTYVYTGSDYGTYEFKIRAYNAFALGTQSAAKAITTAPFLTPTIYKSIAGGSSHTAALLADGTMRTWGAGANGQLGNSTITASQTTAVIPTSISNVVAIACRGSNTAVLLTDGTIRTWGSGGNGQLGNGTTTISQTTAVIPTDVSNVVAIACGTYHTAALLADGTMRTWGGGAFGQLGNSTITASQTTAVIPTSISNVVAIACGNYHTAILLTDGTMRTWGGGEYGQLGNNTTTLSQTTAVTPTGVSNVVAIACGNYHTASLLADGTMLIWGYGGNGNLGNNTKTASQTTAVIPTDVSNVVSIACGTNHIAALLADGTMRTWGFGLNGELGNGLTTLAQTTAVTPINVSNVVAIACGSTHTIALLADGMLRTWGSGGFGQLGNNTTTASQLTAVTPWTSATDSSPLSGLAIIKPSFKLSAAPIYNNYPLSAMLHDLSAVYQPGVISQRGIAIVGASGTWEYSTNSGSTWTSLGVVSTSFAVALSASPAVRLRCGQLGVDTLTVKAWSTQQATPALATTGVDTTVATATIQGQSFSATTTTMQSTTQPVPPVPTLATAVGGDTQITATFSASPTNFIAGYTVDIGGTTYNVASSPAVITGILPGTYTVKVRAYNYDGIASAYSTTVSGVNVIIGAPITYRSIAAGATYTAALLADGTMRTWGNGYSGQLGNGLTIDMSTTVTPCNISNVVSIAGNNHHTAALLSDGTMRIWGAGLYGQLGNGSTVDMSTAVTPTGVSNVVAIACGGFHTAVLLADGTMRTWGSGSVGQLGNGSRVQQTTAVTPTNASNVVTIACGSYHTATLLADGTMRTWGNGRSGQLGNGSTVDMSTAVIPTNVSNVVTIACGGYHTAALLSDGTMRTWGNGGSGQLGNGSTYDTSRAVTPTGVSNVVAIACGESHTAALLANGTMRTWGQGVYGQLGNGLTAQQTTAVTPTGISNCVAIACGDYHTAALLVDGTMQTWGYNFNGQLGIRSNVDMSRTVTPCNISNVAIIKPSFKLSTTPLYNNYSLSQLLLDINNGYQPGTISNRGIAIIGASGTWEYSVNSGSTWTTLGAVSTTSALALRGDTAIRFRSTVPGTDTLTVKAWSTQQATPAVVTTGVDTTVSTATIQGYSFSTGTTTMISTIQPVPPVPTLVSAVGGDIQLAATFSITSTQFVAGYTIDVSGTTYNVTSSPVTITGIAPGIYTVKVRAYNYDGIASAYSTTVSGVNVIIGAPITYRSIACGANHTAALLADGTMRTWGSGGSGRLGNGSTIDMSRAVTPTGVSNVVTIACGGYHTAALLADGTMRTWGSGGYGQLGNGLIADMYTAAIPIGMSNVVAIACGVNYTAALLADGTMRTWGWGMYGRLGIGSAIDMSTAVTPCNISNIVAIACGNGTTATLLSDGTMRTWGFGANGRLGNGSTVDMSTAVTPTGVSNCVAIACGYYHTAALLADGTTRTWGRGIEGQLGNGSTVDMSTAVTSTGVSNVVAIACGLNHTAALLTNGTMRTWGWSAYGQLGIGSTVQQTTAVTPTSVSNVIAISCGEVHTAALLADGTMRTWGSGANGQLGINSTIDMLSAVTPCNISNVAIVNPSFKLLTAPIYNNFPLSTILVDISNGYQPGTISNRGIAIVGVNGTWEYSTNSGSTWTSLGVVSTSSAVALRGDPAVRLRCMQLGVDTLTVKAWSTQQATPALVTTGVDTTVSTVTIQGYSFSTGTTTMQSTAQPVPPVPTLVSAVGGELQVTATFSASPTKFIAGYTVDISGTTYNVAGSPGGIGGVTPGTYTVKIRSYNYDGIASAYSTSITDVVVTPLFIYKYNSIGTGAFHTSVIYSNGYVRSWGKNTEGQLGGTGTAPITASDISNAIAISCGYSNTVALLRDKTVRTWGGGSNGQLGNGTNTTSQSTPVSPTGISNCIAIKCGDYHVGCVLVDGTVRMWGKGTSGQLGNGLAEDKSTAVTPINVSNVIAIACGSSHTAVLLRDGTIMTWGANGSGQLGLGTTTPSQQTQAVIPPNISNCVAIACGGNNTAVLIADGTMRIWGANGSGQLGIASTTNTSSIATPINVSNVVAITCGSASTAAVIANGSLRTWGDNTYYQLGDYTNTTRTSAITPAASVLNDNTALEISVSFHTVCLRADTKIAVCGNNDNKQVFYFSTNQVVNMPESLPDIDYTIIKPSFKIPLTTTINTDLSNIYFLDISTGYQSGTVPYRGLAVTATTGTWQYSTNSGSSWTTISGVTATAALAIRLETTVRIKCTAAGVLTVKAWSAQQATPATVTSGVDTTVATATIQGYSFSAATQTITAS
jgi:alpha-tubulin suppressor-like RCC1 family protein